MFQVIVVFMDGHEEKQGKYRVREYAEARIAGLMKHYPGAINDCRIEPTGKDRRERK